MKTQSKASQAGTAMVEFGLIFPVFLLIVLVAVDFGVYVMAFVSVESAARAAVMRNSSGKESASDQATACRIVKDALKGLPSAGSASADCSTAPVTVTAAYCDSDRPCPGIPSTADGDPATVVTVQYHVPAMFQIPLVGGLTISRTAQMHLGGAQ